MGLFSQKQQEPSTWAALPGEPLDEGKNERLEEIPNMDLFGVGLGTTSTSMVFPVTPPVPEASDVTASGEPEDESDSDESSSDGSGADQPAD